MNQILDAIKLSCIEISKKFRNTNTLDLGNVTNKINSSLEDVKKLDDIANNIFIKNLFKIGYPKNKKIRNNKYLKIITLAFQRRFRQDLVNGIIDQECLLISKNLAKNLK